MESPKSQRQLLSSVYGLNKSFTKRLIVGLEFDEFADKYYKPVVRLTGLDNTGIVFYVEEWKEFTKVLPEVLSYLKGQNEELFDTKMYGCGWILRFTRSHKEKAIEVEQDRRPTSSDGGAVKRYRHTVVMKEVTCRWLNEFVLKSVESRLEYLLSIGGIVGCIAKESVKLMKNKSDSLFDSQVDVYSLNLLREAGIVIEDTDIDSLVSSVEACSKELENQNMLCKHIVSDVFFQIITYHMSEIHKLLNV